MDARGGRGRSLGRWAAAILILAVLLGSFSSSAPASEKVTVFLDDGGWRLKVGGSAYFVKGVVWSYTPIGETFTFNLWERPEEHIKAVLDHDGKLMKAAGINTIRTFAQIPPKWITYLYEEYGIMTIVNHLMGRYGFTVGGIWRPQTDYSDPATRAAIKEDVVELIARYKGTPGVLMYALGNENNYGLYWTGTEIQDLPEDERQKGMARHLYTLFEEIIVAGKKVDDSKPWTIVNGDIQFLDLIAEEVPSLDILGSNVYRGRSFTDLWERVKAELGKPVCFMEFGCDAFNARTFTEDQAAQASYIRDQWKEIYEKSWGQGQEGNAIGGFLFEWRDEWWKYLQTENLDKQDKTASWSNGAYKFDYVEKSTNMNEEWFGIIAIGPPNADGVTAAYPRAAYYTLQGIFAVDPYESSITEVAEALRELDMDKITLTSEIRRLSRESRDRSMFRLAGGGFRGEFVASADEQLIKEEGQKGVIMSHGEWLFLDFEFQLAKVLQGRFTINVMGNAPERLIETEFYGNRVNKGEVVETFQVEPDGAIGPDGEEVDLEFTQKRTIRSGSQIELYDFEAKLSLNPFDLLTFYHTPRYHWRYEGDVYGLLWEATDIKGMDLWNAKAPIGAEFDFTKGKREGFKLVLGPEVYWGANPLVMVKYWRKMGDFQFSILHSEEFGRFSEGDSPSVITLDPVRRTTVWTRFDHIEGLQIELAGIMAGTERIGDEYDRVSSSGRIEEREIDFEDTLGGKVKVTVDGIDRIRPYASAAYQGLVADGGEPHKEFGTLLPYSQFGNKIEYEAGVGIFLEEWIIFPRVLYRENLEEANPLIEPSVEGTVLQPGILPRNREDDPFSVTDNRQGWSAEIFFTYDPTGGTGFYEWNNDEIEDSDLVFNFGFNYTSYDTKTDSWLRYSPTFQDNVVLGPGLEPDDVWAFSTRWLYKPTADLRLIGKFEAAREQSWGAPGPSRDQYGLHLKALTREGHFLAGYAIKDGWGPYDFQRQLNFIWPWQFGLEAFWDISQLMPKSVRNRYGKRAGLGVRTQYRTLGDDSPEYEPGVNGYEFDVTLYFKFEF
jgi:beta-galactosidase